MKKKRIDDMLIERGLAQNKHDAFIKVTEGTVFVDSKKAISPAEIAPAVSRIVIKKPQMYAGRGALKLAAALDAFAIRPKGKVCADIGTATGGFTHVLLLRGAERVYAIDTARGKLALSLRNDPRVVVMEKTDIRNVEELEDEVCLITIDVSLLSLREILPRVRRLLKKDRDVIALFKPQYEMRDPRFLIHGIIRDPAVREKLLNEFLAWLVASRDWTIAGHIVSPIRGSKGNVEFLLHLKSR